MQTTPKKIKPEVDGVPETMLWTVYNRASECLYKTPCLVDPKCVEIYNSLDYDFEKTFGKTDYSHGFRSAIFDEELEKFLDKNPNAMVINLGEGLETQRYRLDKYKDVTWVTVDLPEAIRVRELFIQPDEKHIHIAKSALDFSWADDLDKDRPVFVTAQGLLMYFTAEQNQALATFLAKTFPGCYYMFDFIHKFLADKTLSKKGWIKGKSYRAPNMPWGSDRDKILPLFNKDLEANGLKPIEEFEFVYFRFPHGFFHYFLLVVSYLPKKTQAKAWNKLPGIVKLRFAK